MAAILIPLLLLATAAALVGRSNREGRPVSLRDALETAGVWVALWGAAGAELLSVPHALAYGPLLAWWGLPVIAALGWAWRGRRRLGECLAALKRPDARTALLLAPVVAVLAVSFVVAILTPTTTWDCLQYHLPRQVFWIQNAGVQHYPATDLRQLEMPPLSEFLGVELMILERGDRAANMIQWTAFALSVVVASAIARDLGVAKPGQAFAALLVATVPAAATQAVNAKNDIAVGFFALVLLHQGVRIWSGRACDWTRSLVVGLALGLMILTKGTALVMAVPLGLFIAAGAARGLRWRCLPAGAVMIVVAVAINAGHWSRNYQSFGDPIALPRARGGHPLRNELLTPAGVASIAVRNLALQAGSPSGAANAWIEARVESCHRLLGVPTSDARTTSIPSLGFDLVNLYPSDGNNPAPVHLLLAGAMLVVTVVRPRQWLRAPCWPIYLIPATAFLVFCTTLAWQPWHNRLLIPIAMVIAPPAAAMFGLPRMNVLRVPTAVAAAILVWPGVLLNEAKTLVGPRAVWRLTREEIRYFVEPERQQPVAEAVKIVRQRGSAVVAVQTGLVNSYPLMQSLMDLSPSPRIVVAHRNFGPPIPADAPYPDVIIAWPRESAVPYAIRGSVYEPLLAQGGFCVYGRTGAVPTDLPDFTAWDSASGLTASDGPYPQWSLPLIRWGLGPKTSLTFSSDGAPCDLIVEARRLARVDQPLTVSLNGVPLRDVRLGNLNEFIFLRIPLKPSPGANHLEIGYGPAATAGTRMVVFRRLKVVPALETAPPGDAD